jgi:hypothetical protein
LSPGGELDTGLPGAEAGRDGEVDHAEIADLRHPARTRHERTRSALNAAFDGEFLRETAAIDGGACQLSVVVADEPQ